ncbi:MAG: hypothetical protein ACK4OG_14405 [Parvibaculum sp.]
MFELEPDVQLGRVMANLPEVLDRAERTARLLAESVDEEGVRIHPASAEAIARAQEARSPWRHPAFWAAIGAAGALILTKLF